MDKFVLNEARLAQCKYKYDMDDELSLRKPAPSNRFSSPMCKCINCSGASIFPKLTGILLDTTCELLPRHIKVAPITPGTMEKIIACLATRYDCTMAAIRPFMPEVISEWGKVHILPDGDTINASALHKVRKDTRDATFVRVSSANVQPCDEVLTI